MSLLSRVQMAVEASIKTMLFAIGMQNEVLRTRASLIDDDL